ncbi:MAG TPA: hypothetical protein VMF32_17905 [Xanthobacteraceae bacterium]|nr:hypothetical protein [Xanthobacteraceae bacterium]
MPKQGTSLRNLTIVALAAASLSLPLAAHAQSTDPNILAIDQGTTVPVQPGASQSDPNISAMINGNRPLYNSAQNPGGLSSDPNIRAIEQGTVVPVQPGASGSDPNLNAVEHWR